MQPFRAAPGVAAARAIWRRWHGPAASGRCARWAAPPASKCRGGVPTRDRPPAPRRQNRAAGRGPAACATTGPRRPGRAAWLCPPGPRRENRRGAASEWRSKFSRPRPSGHRLPFQSETDRPAARPIRTPTLARCRLRDSSLTDSRSQRPSAAAARVAQICTTSSANGCAAVVPTATLPQPLHSSNHVPARCMTWSAGGYTGEKEPEVVRKPEGIRATSCAAWLRFASTRPRVRSLASDDHITLTRGRARERNRHLGVPFKGSRPVGHDHSPPVGRPRRPPSRGLWLPGQPSLSHRRPLCESRTAGGPVPASVSPGFPGRCPRAAADFECGAEVNARPQGHGTGGPRALWTHRRTGC